MSRPEPIPVRLLKFTTPQDAPGLSVASSVTASAQSNRGRHSLEFCPWLRAFRLTYRPPTGEPQVGYIPEGRVAYWEEVGSDNTQAKGSGVSNSPPKTPAKSSDGSNTQSKASDEAK